MNKRKSWKGVLVAAATAGVVAMMSMSATAQAPAGGPPGGPPRMGMGMGMGMMGPADRPTTIERLGLKDPALKITAKQQGEIDKLVDNYLAEQKVLRAMGAMRASREGLTSAIGNVLDDKQRAAWQAAQAARRPMMGGPGGPPADHEHH
jgi:hypothetical protein